MINLISYETQVSNGRYLSISTEGDEPKFVTCNIAGKGIQPLTECLPEDFERTTFSVSSEVLVAIRNSGGVCHITPGGNVEVVDSRQFVTPE